MGIKTKVFAGFTVVGLLLIISGIIAIYELGIGSSAKGMLKENLKSIELANQMIAASNKIGEGVLFALNGERNIADRQVNSGVRNFLNSRISAVQNIETAEEDSLLKRVELKFRLLKIQVDSAFNGSLRKDIGWYLQTFIPVHESLTKEIQGYVRLNQNLLKDNSATIEQATNRAIMPGLIAITVGIIFIVLFNYFINLYFITPILRITGSVENYLKHSIPYRVKVDTKDEIEQLSSSVEKLIALTKTQKLAD